MPKHIEVYLKNVILSGYKSIDNVSIDFLPGLNIIIGKNAAGKTNFLKFLDKSLKLETEGFINFYSELKFTAEKEMTIKSFTENSENGGLVESIINQNATTIIEIDEKINIDNEQKFKFLESHGNFVYSNTFICHGVPSDYKMLNVPLNFSVAKLNQPSNDLLNIITPTDTKSPIFIKNVCLSILLSLKWNVAEYNRDEIKQQILNSFDFLSDLKELLINYSPIKDIRLNENFNINILEDKKSYNVNNLLLEFYVDDNWHHFENLSDGTKRIFYLISEVYDIQNSKMGSQLMLTNFGAKVSDKYIPRIVLIEEPELGVHPHQLKKIMDFLKEQSERKQIIITTHSPQALNILSKKDLKRIIIAYSTVEGTKLRHLYDNELKNAEEYISESFLSDYWLYAGLER